MEIGVDSFAAVMVGDERSTAISNTDAIAHLVERIERADRAGLNVFGIG